MRVWTAIGLLTFGLYLPSSNFAASARGAFRSGDQMLADYFRIQTRQIQDRCLTNIHSLDDWKVRRDELRQELFEMLGLAPLPERTDLKPIITGRLDAEEFTVEKLHFQSIPGLYVTGDLYLPKNVTKPVPAILYVCGHALVKTNGVSYGNKTAYQHHGEWFARNGYVCLTIDTLQLGEIEGIHHGTFREGMWWWNSRGYTPAGVEAWNGIRALDYLQSRPEVDGTRLGVTGRSGGGAYSWWIAALDDRIKVAAPVAGITDLQNHVVDGTVEGHCDCMFMVNTYGWDYATVAALVAPRPLLIGNSDKDSIFPLDGVVRVHAKVAEIYKLYGAAGNLGLLITEGPHHDTQDLQLPVFRWFNRHLKGEDPIIAMAASPLLTASQLRVFGSLPADQRNTKIQETFVPSAASPEPPMTEREWRSQADSWKDALRDKVFRNWPQAEPNRKPVLIAQEQTEHGRLETYQFDSDGAFPLRLYLLRPATISGSPKLRLWVVNSAEWNSWMQQRGREFPNALHDELERLSTHSSAQMLPQLSGKRNEVLVLVAPRGIGLSAWKGDARKQVQIRRRFMLLGQTLDSMRVWDIRRAMQTVRALPGLADTELSMQAEGELGVDVLYAALFEPAARSLELTNLPASHERGPDYLNVLRFLDIPQAVALVAEKARVQLDRASPAEWTYPLRLSRNLGWPADRVVIQSASN